LLLENGTFFLVLLVLVEKVACGYQLEAAKDDHFRWL
jgi:hypothetical protein